MLENEFLDLKKECITNLYLCAENVAKYVDGDDHKQFELERLHSSLQQYCTLNIQEDVASEAMEKTKVETNDSNIDTFEARYKIHLEELARARPQNNNHQFVSEFNRRYQKALPSVTNAAQDSMTQDADVVINESESQQQYIDPYRKQPIKDPVRNTLCGHYYEKVVIMDLIQGNKRTKCAGKKFNSDVAVQTAFKEFIDSRPHGIFSIGINELPMRWQKCIDNNGANFD